MGSLQLSTKLGQRLPFGSSVFGAAALTALVGLPATVVMVMAWWGHRWHEARSLLHRTGSPRALTRRQTGPVRLAANDRTRDRDTIHNLDKDEQRAFWVRSAQNMWAGREKERQCRLQTPHPEHNYRYDSTPDYLMYWCRGRD
jgi:hypothetical protein